jgi:hypothetical protein
MSRLRTILAKGLGATESQWPDVRAAFGWAHRAAAILRDRRGSGAAGVRRRYRGLIGAVARHRRTTGRLAEAFAHLLRATRSSWPGLFACYDVGGVPRTNNDLEALTSGMCLVGCAHNFCWAHDSLRVGGDPELGREWPERTPAMAAGLTDHCGTMREWLSQPIPIPPWVPPKRRGRPPKRLHEAAA